MVRRIVVAVAMVAAGRAASAQQRLQVIAPPIELLESRARIDSNDAGAHYALALAYWGKKRFDDAERSLRTAVSIERRFAPGYLALAYLPYARRPKLLKEEVAGRVPPEWRDDVQESWRMRRHAFLIDPLVDLRVIGLVVPLGGGVSLGPRGRVRIVVDPFAAFVRGDYEFAYSTLSSVIDGQFKDQPRDSVPSALLWYRGLSAAHVGAYDTAIADFESLLARSSSREQSDSVAQVPLLTNDYRYCLALFKYRAHHYADAISLYKEALTNNLGLFMAHVQMGRIYEGRKMWSEAVAEFQAAVATSPDDPSLMLDLGVVLREAGRLAEAETTLAQAMNANPRDSRVPYHLGMTLQEQGKAAEARLAFRRFIELAPSRYQRQLMEAKQRLATLSSEESPQ